MTIPEQSKRQVNAMSDDLDAAARQEAEQFYDEQLVVGGRESCIARLLAYRQAQRRQAFEEAAKEIDARLTTASVLGVNRFSVPEFQQWLRQQAVQEEGGGMRMIYRLDQVLDMIRECCAQEGSQYQWATKHKLSPAYVGDVLKGRRNPGPAVLRALKLEAVIQYREVR